MKASELRIGNWIYEFGEAIQIDILDLSQMHYCDLNDGTIIHKPIPLTEEWLIKFGGELTILEHFNRYFIDDDDFSIDYNAKYNSYYFNIGYDYGKTIEYVHQLQNLYFALTGEELTI